LSTLQRIETGYGRLFSKGGSEEGIVSFHSHWKWVTVLDDLSGGDFLKWNEITKRNVLEFLNAVSYYKDKADYIAEQSRVK
jgi:hypothetical protein